MKMCLVHHRCQHADEARVKEQHLKMVTARERMARRKAELDESDTGHKMAQRAIDKAAQEYRQHHLQSYKLFTLETFCIW